MPKFFQKMFSENVSNKFVVNCYITSLLKLQNMWRKPIQILELHKFSFGKLVVLQKWMADLQCLTRETWTIEKTSKVPSYFP